MSHVEPPKGHRTGLVPRRSYWAQRQTIKRAGMPREAEKSRTEKWGGGERRWTLRKQQKVDALPGNAKAVRNSGKHRHKMESSKPGLENQRGEAKAGLYTRRLGKLPRHSPHTHLWLFLDRIPAHLNISNQKGIASASTQRNHKERMNENEFNFPIENENSPKKCCPKQRIQYTKKTKIN